MSKESKSLSEKMFDGMDIPEHKKLFVKDIKEHVKRAERRLKEGLEEYDTVDDLKTKIDKIFLEEFGDKLVEKEK